MSAGPSYTGLSAYPPSPPQLSPHTLQHSNSNQGSSHLPTPLQPVPGPSSGFPPAAGGSAIVHFDPDASDDDDEDDEGRPKKKSKAGAGADGGEGEDGEREKGRRKIDIKYIEKKEKRHITFSKRKAGIMKKAYELATLTGTQVLLLVVSETGIVYTFTTTKFQPLVGAGENGLPSEGQRLIQQCLAVDPDENSDYISPPPDGPLLPLPPSAAKRPFETNSAIHGGQISLRTRTHRPSARAKRPANIRTNNPSSSGAAAGTSSPGVNPNPSPPTSGTLPSPLTAMPMGVTMPRSPMHPPTPGIHVAMEMAGGPGPSQPGGGGPQQGGQGMGMPVSPGPQMARIQHDRLGSGDMRMHTSPTNREYPTSPGLSGGGPGLRGHDPMQSRQEYAAMMHRAAMSAQGQNQYAPPRDHYMEPYGQPTRYTNSPVNSPRQPHMDTAQLQQRIAQAQQMEQQGHHQPFHAPMAGSDDNQHMMMSTSYLPPQPQYAPHPNDQYMIDQQRR